MGERKGNEHVFIIIDLTRVAMRDIDLSIWQMMWVKKKESNIFYNNRFDTCCDEKHRLIYVADDVDEGERKNIFL